VTSILVCLGTECPRRQGTVGAKPWKTLSTLECSATSVTREDTMVSRSCSEEWSKLHLFKLFWKEGYREGMGKSSLTTMKYTPLCSLERVISLKNNVSYLLFLPRKLLLDIFNKKAISFRK
jgi:hypothetical protein